MSETADPAFEALLQHLKVDRGFDFTGYKRASLRRRVEKRMASVGIQDVEAYHDFLEVHPEEFAHLFDTILINVTGWFRDPARWQYLADEVVPQILARRPEGPIRVWSAGCATGQEAYSIAMLFAEAMGGTVERLKIYATDVDEQSLDVARQASYPADELDDVPPELRERYFTRRETRLVVRPDLRRSVIFGRHDLVRDAPISRLDLILCRNVLMYFNRDTQSQVLDHLHFALADDGYLFLGNAEMMLTRTERFESVSLPNRVFRKAAPVRPDRSSPIPGTKTHPTVAEHVRMREAAFASTPLAQFVVDADGLLILASTEARALFGLSERDLGRPFRDLELSYRPIELRSQIDQVRRDRQVLELRGVERPLRSGDTQYFDVRLTPLDDDSGHLLGISVAFRDISQAEELRLRLQRSHRELEAAYEELQSTNEELETTNEELNSTVEELETTNEELHSSYEELETLNEELQSANAEQEEINHELTVQSAERDRLNVWLRSILRSLDAAVVVIDTAFAVELWNESAFELWGLRADEVQGRSLLHLDIGLPVEDLVAPVREVLAGSDKLELELDATNRRGFSLRCRTVLTPLLGSGGTREGVVLLMEPHPEGETM